MPKFPLLIVLAVSFPIGASAQTTQPRCSTTGNFAAQSMAVMRTGVGTPYSLIATIKTNMELSDGNTLNAFTTSHQVRDSQGRTRVEEPTSCAIDKDGQPHWQGSITVIDPVAKTHTLWQENLGSVTKNATVTHMPFVNVSTPPTAQMEYREAQQMSQAYDHMGPQTKHDSYQVEDLGKRNIARIAASGIRITRTSPAGMVGNSLPLTYVEEKWVSDQYGVIVLDIKDDPVFGKSTYEVNDFTPGEPDASLFQPPADYKINERTVGQ